MFGLDGEEESGSNGVGCPAQQMKSMFFCSRNGAKLPTIPPGNCP